MGDTAVKSDDRLPARRRLRKLELAHDRDEPLVPVSPNRTAFRFTFERPMNDGSYVAEFGKTERASHQPPYVGMWLGETQGVSAPALPARRTSNPLEAALPGLIELDQELRADIARHVSQKGKLSAELLELNDLVESVRVAANGTRQAKLPLLECEVPKKTK